MPFGDPVGGFSGAFGGVFLKYCCTGVGVLPYKKVYSLVAREIFFSTNK